MEYPLDAITAKDKTEYLYNAQEALRELHNKFVVWHEDGLLQTDYDTLPVDIKKKYEFVNSIDLSTLKRFIDEDFMLRSSNICQEIVTERSKLSEIDRDEIMGTRDPTGKISVAGTKHLLIKSKRWVVDAGIIEKIKKVLING